MIQKLQTFLQLFLEIPETDIAAFPFLLKGAADKVGNRKAGNLKWLLEGKEHAVLRPLVRGSPL